MKTLLSIIDYREAVLMWRSHCTRVAVGDETPSRARCEKPTVMLVTRLLSRDSGDRGKGPNLGL